MSTDAVRMSQWPSDQRYVIPVAPGPDVVTVTIDGNEVQAPRGELLIKVAQEHGTYIPRFCWHERMKPVGMCRMCLVEVEGMRGMQISCATPVTDGMVVNTQSPNVKAVQDGVLEFLLINHPLDCPVCDRGGECPLQDQTLAFGPGESRFVEEKRHFEKPVPISDLVLLDRERCIQCGRCTRFAAEIAGDPLIDFGERGGNTEVITYPDEPFSSYFSGNTVQICPVGALTASAYRFRARPWDLADGRDVVHDVRGRLPGRAAEHVEPHRAPPRRRLRAGEPGLALRQGSLRLRVGALRGPRPRADGAQERRAGRGVVARGARRRGRRAPGARSTRTVRSSVAVLGGARGTNEDAYVWARFAKGVLGTDNVDAQLGDGLPAEVVLGLPGATIADIDRARGDRARRARPARGAAGAAPARAPRRGRARRPRDRARAARDRPHPRRHRGAAPRARARPASIAEQLARALAGDGTASGNGSIEKAVSALDGRDGDIVVVLGRQSLAESPASVVHAAAALAALPGREVPLRAAPGQRPRRARPRPHARASCPVGSRSTPAATHFADAWGAVPARARPRRRRHPRGRRRGQHRGAGRSSAPSPSRTSPTASACAPALDAVPFVVAVGAFTADAAARADVVPAHLGVGREGRAAAPTSRAGCSAWRA